MELEKGKLEPSNLKALKRELKPCQTNQDEPIPFHEENPEPPENISPEARKVWEERAPDLAALKLLTVIDKAAFMRYCEFTVEWIKARDAIKEKGSTTYVYEVVPDFALDGKVKIGADGKAQYIRRLKECIVHPEVVLFKKYAEELNKLETQFGLTPASRSKMIVDYEKYLKEKKAPTNPRNRYKYSQLAKQV